MKVVLVSYTPQPEELVASAAKVCYSSLTPEEIIERVGADREQTEKYLDMLTELGHESPIEHISFTFCVSGVSRSLLAQLTRHRIASYSVRSQRYVSETDFGVVLPPQIAQDPEAAAVFEQTVNACRDGYRKLTEILTRRIVERDGIAPDNKSALSAAARKAAEDARFVLPNACETQLFFTMNARSLLNFFRHRCCERAQWEIRAMAEQMLALVYPVAPHIFAKAGPACLCGKCPEGKMSCGRMAQKQAQYAELKGGARHE